MLDLSVFFDTRNMESHLIKILSVNLIIVAFVAANRQTENIQATTSTGYIYKSSQLYNEDHVWIISPTTGVSSSHFLAISWYFLSVHGTMPNCDNDYVEVFLTRYVKIQLPVRKTCGAFPSPVLNY